MAREELRNPYRVYKQVLQRFLKMGAGARWPGPDFVYKDLAQREKKRNVDLTKAPSGKVQVPQFERFDVVEHLWRKHGQDPEQQESTRREEIID